MNVCQQEFCIVFYFVKIGEVVSSKKVLPQTLGVLDSPPSMSKSASMHSSFFHPYCTFNQTFCGVRFFSLYINFSVYIYPVDITEFRHVVYQLLFLLLYILLHNSFCGEKKIICSNIIVCFVWFNIFFKTCFR